MKRILVCGGGGIGEAVVILFAKKFEGDCHIVVSDANQNTLDTLKSTLSKNFQNINVDFFKVDFNLSLEDIHSKYDFIFDCLPGVFAPKVAQLAIDTKSNYINLTEYVDETNAIKKMDVVDSTLVLQSGVAPGFVNLLGMTLMKEMETKFPGFVFQTMEMKVGALSSHASSPHFYAFTWSPIGVATEYLKPAIALLNGEVQEVPSLAEIKELIISGVRYENAFTSGGVADLADNLSDKFENINYQTMRYPGHFDWVNKSINEHNITSPNELLDFMTKNIPHVEDDFVIVYASVIGHDHGGKFRKHERVMRVDAQVVSGIKLKAIQISTAVPMIVTAINVLESNQKGVVLQSQLDCEAIMKDDTIVEYFREG